MDRRRHQPRRNPVAPAVDSQGTAASQSRVIPIEHDGFIRFDERPLDYRQRQSVPLQYLIIERHQYFAQHDRPPLWDRGLRAPRTHVRRPTRPKWGGGVSFLQHCLKNAVLGFAQAIHCRRRHQQRRPPRHERLTRAEASSETSAVTCRHR